MDEKAVRIISNYIKGLPKPSAYNSNATFEYRSYTLYSAEAILERVEKSADKSGAEVVEDFIRGLDMMHTSVNQCKLFEIAFDTADHILDLLLGIK